MPSLNKQPVHRTKLSQVVFDQLVTYIREEELAPGDTLPTERELMASFEVGRPVVREAMQRLENLGLISIHHGERARVRQLDMDDLLQQIDFGARHLLTTSTENLVYLREARIFFETGLARIVATNASGTDFSGLSHALDLMRKYQKNKDRERFIEADVEFHMELAKLTGNPIFVALSKAILEWISDYRKDALHTKGTDISVSEHEDIYEALIEGNVNNAVNCMRVHLIPNTTF